LRALRSRKFDVVHLHEPFAPGASYALLLFATSPLVGTFHRSGPSAFYNLLRPLARAGANRLKVRCAVSEEALATVRKALGGHYELIGNGVDLEHFASAAPSPTTNPTSIFVGRHEPRKGLAVLLEAFEGIKGATLWICGSGPQTPELMARFPQDETRKWLGRVADDELARRLAGAHVACFPSLGGESFGVVLLEAMAARCVAVASDLPGYRYVAAGNAELFEPGNVGSLHELLQRTLDDSRSGRGRSAPASLDAAYCAASRFSMAEIAARYVSVYEDVAG
jgi:phosphatidylinositol alpha-mannosyltransferase